MQVFGTQKLTLAIALATIVSTGAQARSWEYVVEPKYDFAYDFSNGWAAVAFDHEFTRDEGYIDAKGTLMRGGLPFASAHSFKNGYAIAVDPGYPDFHSWLLMDTTGKEIMRPHWEPSLEDSLTPGCQDVLGYRLEGEFSHGLVPVSILFAGVECPSLKGFADVTGRVRFLRYFSVQSFQDGVAVVWPEYTGQYEGNRHLIDLQGNKISATFDRIEASSEGLSVACLSKLCGLLNTDGSYFKRLVYDDLKPFSEHRAAFKDGKRWGYLNRDGNVAIAPRFATAGDFHEGLAAVTTVDGVAGYIDSNGEWAFKVSGVKHWDLEAFSEGLARVRQDGKWGYVDKTGTFVVPAMFGDARDFHEGLAAVSVSEFHYGYGRWGFIQITE